ncbi:MAG: DNA polymerase III subunit delta' [Anaerolineales bacterium]|nr:DNA polymerase III subunit delta' [Anaerolineales bacterium]
MLSGTFTITIFRMETTGNEWPKVVGHEWAIEILTSGIRNGLSGHAFLLSGPEHIGKTTLARTLAQALNCESVDSIPCQKCRSCKLIAQDGHPDVRIIEPEMSSSGRTETLRINQVRELQKELALSPYEGRYRVAILVRFQNASIGAANALLKTLEEPPDRVKLVITADSVDTLLPTIKSRCQLLPLRPLATEKVQDALVRRWGAMDEQAYQLAHISGGRLGIAVRYLANSRLLDQRTEYLDILEQLIKQDRTARFRIADTITRQKGGATIQEALELWLGWWRDVMLAAGTNNNQNSLVNVDRVHAIQAAAEHFGLQVALQAVSAILQTLDHINRNVNTRLAIEVLMLDLPTW